MSICELQSLHNRRPVLNFLEEFLQIKRISAFNLQSYHRLKVTKGWRGVVTKQLLKLKQAANRELIMFLISFKRITGHDNIYSVGA